MSSARIQQLDAKWLVGTGLRELELLLRAVYSHSSQPVLIVDDSRRCLDASFGAGRLLGLSRDQIVARRIDDFAEPGFQPQIERLWPAFLEEGEQEGTLPLEDSAGTAREVGYVASGSVLPGRHLLVLLDKTGRTESGEPAQASERVPSWVKDSALLLLDAEQRVAAWHSGAARIYGYKSEEAIGKPLSFLCPDQDDDRAVLQVELARAASAGRFGSESWHRRKDRSRLWANALTVALRDDNERLLGFARVVRDFSERHEMDRQRPDGGERTRPCAAPSAVVGVVSGEFDKITDASDTFVAMVGHSHDDLVAGRPYWPNLTPREYAPLDDWAHEEGLIHGACTPFEKEFICKDGSRVPVLVTRAVLSLSPFRWTSFVQDLTEPQEEPTDDDAVAHVFEGIVGDSVAMRRVLGQVKIVAPTDATVLVLGETGTGKELVARAIHTLSERSKFPFVTLNCAAIPTGLLESELFGYEKGAFTGALSRKIGRFEMAHQGTLFLDEVGDIPLDLQPKLLRALQEKEFERLGGIRTIPIDVRLVAATNRNLTQMMGDKLFRSDLYYRLKVFPITTPPLRDHPEDIPLLARHFTQKYASQMKRNIETIPPETMTALENWSWPGNVRELENFIERSVILSQGSTLRAPWTSLMPKARGEAKVESKQGYMEIEVEFDDLEPATKNGAEYLTYVLWAISPEGRTSNLGEVLLNGTKSKLNVTTELQVFGLVVTAEPYFSVTRPSDLVVMENVVRADTRGKIVEIDAKYELLKRGQYKSLANPLVLKLDRNVPLELYEARNAVQIAKSMGAEQYASDTFEKAENSLQQAEAYQARKAGKKPVTMTARQAVQTAEDARAIAVQRQEEEALANERQAAAERETLANDQRAAAQSEAARVTRNAETARADAQSQADNLKRDNDAQRLATQAEADRLKRENAAQTAAARTEADRLKQENEAQRAAAQANLDRAARERAQAESEKKELRAQLLQQFSAILETRDSARGLIVNMSDVLFDTAKSTLRPAAREKLAKVAGVISGHPGLALEVEGHTDNVGGDDYNQRLSEQRGEAVRDYLAQQGTPSGSITTRGLGETQPVASNDTPAGRQQNRRVELVVSGEIIGELTASARTLVR